MSQNRHRSEHVCGRHRSPTAQGGEPRVTVPPPENARAPHLQLKRTGQTNRSAMPALLPIVVGLPTKLGGVAANLGG